MMAISGPTTEIEIISNALILNGKSKISSAQAGGRDYTNAKALFDQLASNAMSHPSWRFNVKIVQLQLLANYDPDFAGFNYAWQLPADFLSLKRLDPNIPFQIYEDRIFTTGSSPIKLAYNTQKPVSKWPVYFRNFMVYELAYALAKGISEDAKLTADLKADRHSYRSQGRFIDSQNHPNVAIQSTPWISIRGTGYRGAS